MKVIKYFDILYYVKYLIISISANSTYSILICQLNLRVYKLKSHHCCWHLDYVVSHCLHFMINDHSFTYIPICLFMTTLKCKILRGNFLKVIWKCNVYELKFTIGFILGVIHYKKDINTIMTRCHSNITSFVLL